MHANSIYSEVYAKMNDPSFFKNATINSSGKSTFSESAEPYYIKHQRITLGEETPLLTVDASYPAFERSSPDSIRAAATFYSNITERLFSYSRSAGLEKAQRCYDEDTDPQKRFRFRRFYVKAEFLPLYSSESFASVRGTISVSRGRDTMLILPLSAQWLTCGICLPPSVFRRRATEDIYFVPNGACVSRRIEGTQTIEAKTDAANILNEIKTISKLFATKH